MKKIFFIFFVFFMYSVYSQNGRIDSLKTKLKTYKDGSEKITCLNQLSSEYYLISDFDVSISTAELAIKISQGPNKELSNSFLHIGNANLAKSNYDEALKFYIKSLEVSEKVKDDVGVLASCIGIGAVYMAIGNDVQSKEYYTKALTLSEKMNDKKGKATSLISLGNLCYVEADYNKAEEFYLKALQLEIESKNDANIALLNSNLGNIYYGENWKKASEYYQKSIDIRERIKDDKGLTESYYNIALVYTGLKDYDKSTLFLNKAMDLSIKIDSKESIMNCLNGYASLYESMGNIPKAYEYFQKYSSLKDSILNIESSKNINKLNALYESEKKNKTIELLNKEKEKQFLLNEATQQKNRVIIYSVFCVLLIVSVFSFWLYKRFVLTSRQKNTIELQKLEVEQQKELIEEHQKEIKDSINYAKRIQSSFMASEAEFDGMKKAHFILFKPKDVVSGDFYWANHLNDKFYLCVADSTGHGIPGAFMSLLNMSLLNEALLSRMLSSTKDILNFVRKILIKGLKPDESGQGGNDGMDCVMVSLDLKKSTLEYSGANNPLWIVREGVLIELAADKMPVGRSPRQDTSFDSKEFELRSGDVLYLFTDGYADQFGGVKGKKFKYKQLSDLFLSIYLLPLEEQKNITAQKFEEWKGTLEQVDDVCIIGLRI